MGLCTAFVFSALVEFTIVNFWFRKQRQKLNLSSLNVSKCAINSRGIKTKASQSSTNNETRGSKYPYQPNPEDKTNMLRDNYLCSYHQKLEQPCTSTNRQQIGRLR